MRPWIFIPALCALASAALAQDPRGLSPGIAPGPATLVHAASFSRLDRNGDGVIDPSEASSRPALAGQFETVDVDRNGAVDDAEFAVFEADAEVSTVPWAPAPEIRDQP